MGKRTGWPGDAVAAPLALIFVEGITANLEVDKLHGGACAVFSFGRR